MKQIRWRVILLVVWLTLLFNIERFDLQQGNLINLTPSTYVLAIGAVTVFLLVSLNRRQMYAASLGVVVAYTMLKVLNATPFFSGVHKYITVTEIVGLLVTAFLAWLVNQALYDFEGAVEAISMPEGRPQLLAYEKIQERMRAEMGRARRHQRPISVAMIDLDPSTFEAALHQAVRDAQAAMIARYVQVRLGLFLSKHIRGTDVIAQHIEGGRFLLLAPETPADQTVEMLKRLANQVESHMGIRFRYSVVDFPNAALTSEELLRKAAEDLQHASFASTTTEDGARPEEAVAVDETPAYASVLTAQEDGLDNMRLTHRIGDKEAGDGTRSLNGGPSKNGNTLVS